MDGQLNATETENHEKSVEKSFEADIKNKSEEQHNELATVISLGVLRTDEDDDNVSEDELGKESAVNIDEDELLKDTEADLKDDSICCTEEEEAILESNSDSLNALQPPVRKTDSGEKQIVSDIGVVITDKLEEKAENINSGTMESSFSEKTNEKEAAEISQSSEQPCNLENILTKNVLTEESDCQIVKSSNSFIQSNCDSDGPNVNIAENSNEQFTERGSDREMKDLVISKGKESTENKKNIRINNDVEENENATTFLHVNQDDSRPDECLEAMELSGEDPFAQTAEDCINNIGNDEINTPTIDKAIDIDNVSLDLKKVLPDNSIALNCDKNINKNTREVDCNINNISTASNTTPQIIETSMEIEPVENNDSKTDFSRVTSLKVYENKSSQNKENCNNKCTMVKQIESAADINHPCASQSKPLEPNQNKDTSGSNEPENEELVTNEINNQSLENSKKNDLCIVPDKDLQPNQELISVTSDVVTPSLNSCRLKYNKVSSKTSKAKSRKSISDESSDDSDLEVSAKSTSRPKRDAAKKAETQIKQVLSAAENEQEVDSIDFGSIDADNSDVEEVPTQQSNVEDIETCFACKKVGLCKVNVSSLGKINHFCNNTCLEAFKGPTINAGECSEIIPPSTVFNDLESTDIQPIDRSEFVRKCSQCTAVVKNDDEKTLSWETMDFCTEECLGKYQQELGSHCANCKGNVQPASLGKYCVRFGYEVKQFCCSSCLEEFKKGLKVCSFCQKDISSGAEGFLAPVGDKGTFKDFCTQACMEKYELMSSNQQPPQEVLSCDVCANVKPVEAEVFFDSKVNKLCSDICFSAYKFANKLTVDRCDMCKKYFDKDAEGDKFNIFYDGVPHNFCCKTCMNIYILAKRKIVPCNWCKVKKYNFDMIKRVQSSGQVLMMCSLNCLTLYQVSVNAVSSRRIKCDMCMSVAQAQYHLTMSDATIRNFCTYPCVMNFQQQYSKVPISLPAGEGPPIPTGAPKRVVHKTDIPGGPVPIISSVTSLVNGQPVVSSTSSLGTKFPSGKPNLVTRLLEPPTCRNKNTQTRPLMNSKSVSCRPHTVSEHSQTEDDGANKILIPIPVPIYIPCPMAMYSFPFPVPIPFAVPVPVPVFLPTTRNSIKGIVKEIKRIQEKVPADPYEAELLMMAEMVADDKKEEASSSDSETENEPVPDTRPDSEGELSPQTMESNNMLGDDIMQMALKMATDLDTPSADLETQLTPAPILNETQTENKKGHSNGGDNVKGNGADETRGRKRLLTKSPIKKIKSSEKKRKTEQNSDIQTSQLSLSEPAVDEPAPDTNMKLKYTFGVNAWKSWVTQKNAEIEEISSTNKKIKPMKTDILQMTTDELNFSLCLFVKEVKKPNGTHYAPDTIYYLCLGIQQYLFVNGRIDNIFTDPYFEPFTDCLDEIARKFTEIFNDPHCIVTRVEEEHLWESMQLGAHSPHVLLASLLFFNTKYFNLTNSEEHMMLSFSHIMKHWKRNSGQAGSTAGGKAPGSRNVLLRFYPPQAVLDDPNSKKKKVYEQREDEENPLRCPVKLYEFYLLKCPESVRNRSDVFYLQPERSCAPDSPVWYSTTALSKEPLEKMLNRVKMVKEINIALLTS